ESCVGYYVPSEGRFFSVSRGGGKEVLSAYAKDGQIYTSDDRPIYKYDKNFDPLFMGFILFFFLGHTA
ncbi:MAG: hypothetical protein LBF05_04275, partial [Tannerella sp.]|nr:hypothetical protein [Tannerella sp.]